MMSFASSNYYKLENIRDMIVNIQPNSKSRVVCLVEKRWYKKLVMWLNKEIALPPRRLDNTILFCNNELRDDIEFKIDFEIVEERAWDTIVECFGKTPKLSRYFVKNPVDESPCVILNPKRIRIIFEGQAINKMCDLSWKFGPIIDLLCKKFNLNKDDYRLYSPDERYRIGENVLISKAVSKFTGDFVYKRKVHNHHLNENYAVSSATNTNKAEDVIRSKEEQKTPTKHKESPTTDKTNHTHKEESPKCPKESDDALINTVNRHKEHRVRRTVGKEEEIPKPMDVFTLTSYEVPTVMFPKPVGFINLGNTCFFNAAMQCLLRVQKLTDFIVSDKFEKQINTENPEGSGGVIARAYREFLLDLCQGSSTRAKDPTNLRNAIISKYRRFANYRQQDSQELLGAVIDGLCEDLNQAASAKGRLPPSPTKKSDDSWKVHIAKNSSPIMNIFHGELISSITCPLCKYSSCVHDPFTFLSVPIGKKLFGSVNLEECIDAFCEKEVLDKNNKWRCPHCNKLVQATKTLNVYRCAPILIVHLKRFDPFSRQKVSTNVKYPDILDLSKICTSGQNGKYRLIGAVFHHGTTNFGHYTAASLCAKTKSWYFYNDSRATKISSSDAHSSDAYILFYESL